MMNDDGSTERREGGAGPAPYGFVNMISDAPTPSAPCGNAGTSVPGGFPM